MMVSPTWHTCDCNHMSATDHLKAMEAQIQLHSAAKVK